MSWILRRLHAGALALVVTAALCIAGDAGRQQIAQAQQGDECHPWQHRDRDGDCVDDSGMTVHPGGYQGGPRQICWVRATCLCRSGEYPGRGTCSPCSQTGQQVVCIPR